IGCKILMRNVILSLFLLRLELLHFLRELLEQLACLRATFLLEPLEDRFLVGQRRELPRLPNFDTPHVDRLGHDGQEFLWLLGNEGVYGLAAMFLPGGMQVAKEVLGEPVAAAGRPTRPARNALEIASALVSDRDAVVAVIPSHR